MNLRESTLKRIVQLMKDPHNGLVIKDRTFHFHVFPDCFVGNEFVTWTLHNSIVDTRERATMLGQDLLDRGIIYHASNDQPFKDGYFFYTFQKFPEISDAELDVMVIRMKAHPTGVSIQDRTHHLRNYRDCFVGKEAVDWFVKNVPKYAPSRQVAVKLGQELMNKGIVHSANQQPFSDSTDFYHFQKPVYAGYLGKLTKTGTDWKIRWFSIKDVKEKKLWYYNSPRDPVPRDFIPLVDACVRVHLDQDIAYMEICSPLRIFTLRPTSSTLLARWAHVLSEFIGAEGCENNLRMELAERSVSAHESRVSSKLLREHRLVSMAPILSEATDSGLLEGMEQQAQNLLSPQDSTASHDSQRSSFGNDTPLDKLSSPENFETLDLMYDDDLDIDIEDDLFLPDETGKQFETLETKFEEGMVGEANFVSVEALMIEQETVEGEEEREVCNDMNPEQQAALLRIKEQLLSTSSQDNDYIPPNTSLSLLPPMFSDESILLPKDKRTGPNDIDHFHVI